MSIFDELDEAEARAKDGDSFELKYPSGRREGLRLKQASTPEIEKPWKNEAGFPGSADAHRFSEDFVQNARPSSDGTRGYFGRQLGEMVSPSEQLLSNELLSKGLAHSNVSSNAQARAKETQFGLKEYGIGNITDEDRMNIARRRYNREAGVNYINNRLQRPSLETDKNFHTDALARGVDQVQQMGYGLMKLVGDSVGSEGLSKLAQAGIDENTLTMMLNPRETRSWTEAEGFAESLGSVYETLIEQVPNIGTTIASALATGGIGGAAMRAATARLASGEIAGTSLVTKAMAKKFVKDRADLKKAAMATGYKRGAAVGAGVASIGMNTGETKITFDREGISNDSKVWFTGLVKGAADMVGLAAIPGLNRLVGMGLRASKTAKKAKLTRAQMFKRVPFKVMQAAAAEGTTEAFQAVADAVAVNTSLDREWSDKDTDAVLESFVVGFAAGKAIGLPGAVVQTAGQKMSRAARLEDIKKKRAERDDEGVVTAEDVPQTDPEARRSIESQLEMLNSGQKRAVFDADDSVSLPEGQKARFIGKRDENGYFVVELDSTQKGRTYFKSRKLAKEYEAKVNEQSAEEANIVTQPKWAKPKTQVLAESEIAGTEPVVIVAANIMEDGSVHSVVQDTIVTEADVEVSMAKMQKDFPKQSIERMSPEASLEIRESIIRQEEAELDAHDEKRVADRKINEEIAKKKETAREAGRGTGAPSGGVQLEPQKVEKIKDKERIARAEAEKTGRAPTEEELAQTAEVDNPVLSEEQASEVETISEGQAMDEQLTITEKIETDTGIEDQITQQEKRDKAPDEKILMDQEAVELQDLQKQYDKARSAGKETASIMAAIKQAKKRVKLKKEADKLLKKAQQKSDLDLESIASFFKVNKKRRKSALSQAQNKIHKYIEDEASGNNNYTMFTREEVQKIFERALPRTLQKQFKNTLKNLPDNVNIFVLSKESEGKGTYSPETKKKTAFATLYLPDNAKVAYQVPEGFGGEVLLHELMHSVSMFHGAVADSVFAEFGDKKGSVKELITRVQNNTLQNITDTKHVAVLKQLTDTDAESLGRLINFSEEILKTYKDFKKQLAKDNIITNEDIIAAFETNPNNINSVSEFMASGRSNPLLVEYLKGKGFLHRLFEAVREFFGVMGTSLNARLIRVTEAIAADNSKLMGKVEQDSAGRAINIIKSKTRTKKLSEKSIQTRLVEVRKGRAVGVFIETEIPANTPLVSKLETVKTQNQATLYKTRVNDGMLKGDVYFNNKKRAFNYITRVKRTGVERANRVLRPKAALSPTEIYKKTNTPGVVQVVGATSTAVAQEYLVPSSDINNPHVRGLIRELKHKKTKSQRIITLSMEEATQKRNEQLQAEGYEVGGVVDEIKFTPRERIPLNKITKGLREVFTKNTAIRVKELSLDVVTPFLTSMRRVKRVSPMLGRLYEKYQRQFHADESQFKAMLNNIYREFSEVEMEQGFSDYIHGKTGTPVTDKMQGFFKQVIKNMQESSVKHFGSLELTINGRPYFPQIHMQDVIRADKEGFIKFLMRGKNGKPFSYRGYDGTMHLLDNKKSATAIADSILEQSDGESLGPEAASAKKRILVDPDYQAAAFDAGWLNKDPRAVMEVYVSSMMKQKNYEETFGGYETKSLEDMPSVLRNYGYTVRDKDPEALKKAMVDANKRGLVRRNKKEKAMFDVWVAGAKKLKLLETVNETKGLDAVHEARKSMNAMDGLLGRELNPKIRKSMQWLTVVQAYTVLAFSTLSSIPEFGVLMAGAIGKDPEAAWKGLKQFVRDTGDYTKQISQNVEKGMSVKEAIKQARNNSMELARLMGAIPDALTATGFIDSSDFEVQGNKPRAAMEKLFTYNLNILFNNSLRSIASNIGAEYFIKKAKAGDAKAMKRFGVTPEQVLQWDKEGRKSFIEGTSTLSPMANALLNFADHHVARPTSMSKSVSGNDPHFMLISQLKSFFYAYGADIIPELGKTMADRYSGARRADKAHVLAGMNAALPLVVIGTMAVPLAYLSQELKASIRELADDDYEERRDKYLEKMGAGERLVDLVRASGVLGPVDLMMSFYDAEQFGQSGVIRALGPTMGHLDTLVKYGPFSPEFVQRTTPILGITSPGLWREWKKEARAERRKKRYND